MILHQKTDEQDTQREAIYRREVIYHCVNNLPAFVTGFVVSLTIITYQMLT